MQVIDCLSETESDELLDKERLRLMQVANIDIQDKVKCGLLTLHMQDKTLRDRQIMLVSSLDAFFEARKELQDIARAKAASSVAPMRIGAVRANCVKDKGRCAQLWYDTMEKARWTPVNTCSCCQRDGHVKPCCRVRARDPRKKANAKKQLCMTTGLVIEGICNTSIGSHGYVFADIQRDGIGWLS